ncbi:ubiquitin-conjugating enzyme E2 T-like [Uloborus diversus]|uniref:ubiquitin-conjugating enzyme E2 T-like n=1 Tax=Uloborus diversus TaxID=327109 RepID=UPI002409C14E|nr:ubiquitin-conjugating enzyme E2 T-like [Uloborus diversus]
MQRMVRLKKEMERFTQHNEEGIACWQADELDELKASVVGPENSPYQYGIFELDIIIPDRYPFVPPNVRFVTPVYHPNIDSSGRICLDILKVPPQGTWKPSLNLVDVLSSIRFLMSYPNFNDPLMTEISDQYQRNYNEFYRHAEEHTRKHAKENVKDKKRSFDLAFPAPKNVVEPCSSSQANSVENLIENSTKKNKMSL